MASKRTLTKDKDDSSDGEQTCVSMKKKKTEADDYLLWTNENVKARSEFFANLNCDQIVTDIKSLSAPASQPTHKKIKPKPIASDEPRRSGRLQNKPPVSLNEMAIAVAREAENISSEERERRFRAQEESIEFCSCSRKDHTADEDVLSFKKVLNELPANLPSGVEKKLSSALPTKVAKVVVSKVSRERAFSLAIHPNEAPIVFAVGDLDGGIGLHCESSVMGRTEFEPHEKRPVSGLAFDDCHLLSTCYDGTLRSLDLNRPDLCFNLLYATDDDLCLTGFDAYHLNCYVTGDIWLSRNDGTVVKLDCRAGGRKVVGTYRVSSRHCRTVSACPERHIVCTSSREGTVAFWDDRAMPGVNSTGKKPLGTYIHSASVSSAFLNPSDPLVVLSTSHDNTVRVSRLEGSDCKTVTFVSHNNNTGRFLTPFRAVWHPVNHRMFGIGSLQQPRRVQLYSSSSSAFSHFDLVDLFHDEISSVQSLLAFHRSLPIVVGVNSSGRTHAIYLKN